ncbi:MAG: hypothetical protein QXK67_06760 [Pyrobaculum sp.]
MQKKDCIFVQLDLCRGDSIDYKYILKTARVRGRKLILISLCGSTEEIFQTVRSIASENMDLPIRYFHGVDIDVVAALEKCTDYEILNLDENS